MMRQNVAFFYRRSFSVFKKKAFLKGAAFLLCLLLFITACTASATSADYSKESGMFFDAFDTVITITGYVKDRATFDRVFQESKALFMRYHQVFDNYHAYDGIANLHFMNTHAGYGYVEVEPELVELLLWLKDRQPLLGGRVNTAMGSVLKIWHAYRTEGVAIPDLDTLMEAATHTDFDAISIRKETNQVFYEDPLLQVDLGAVAKGYAVEIVADYLNKSDMPSYIINAGGNVRCGVSPLDGRNYWGVGIQDPIDTANYLDVVYLKEASVVTSGDYQRYYTVDGVQYHHIIDPDTLMPAGYMHAVTVVTSDSGFADLLSTALFNMPCEQGMALLNTLDGVEAYWYLMDGTVRMTDGFAAMLRSNGASAMD
ncbi:MAG: FAD:protein FMN transferase [Clostridia bacterium]|nr:FAD:protein FMN transferase [Clostridia bacterium]